MEMIRPLFLFEGMSLGEISSRLTDISHKTDGGMKEGVDQKYRDQKCISNMDDTATENPVEECIKKMLEYGLFVMNNQMLLTSKIFSKRRCDKNKYRCHVTYYESYSENW